MYDISAILGMPYSCAATQAGRGNSAAPAQNGTVSAQGIAVAKKILDGLHPTYGKRVCFTYTPNSTWTDPQPRYISSTGEWELDITSLGGSFVEVLLNEQNGTNLHHSKAYPLIN